jgi:hypothetical protein
MKNRKTQGEFERVDQELATFFKSVADFLTSDAAQDNSGTLFHFKLTRDRTRVVCSQFIPRCPTTHPRTRCRCHVFQAISIVAGGHVTRPIPRVL